MDEPASIVLAQVTGASKSSIEVLSGLIKIQCTPTKFMAIIMPHYATRKNRKYFSMSAFNVQTPVFIALEIASAAHL